MGKRYQTGDQALVREINLSIILNCLREPSPLSHAKVAEITGLNKTTVSSLMRELIPELVIFGGVMSLASGHLLPAIEKTLGGRSLAWPRRMVRVMASSYGPNACVMGGVALVLHDILSRPALTT